MATEKNEAIVLVRVFIEALVSLPSSGSYEGPSRGAPTGLYGLPTGKIPEPADDPSKCKQKPYRI
jgi:hypothetical protein